MTDNHPFGSGMFQGQAKFVDYAHMNQQEVQVNTLDEPVLDTLLRDINMILYKLSYVIIPRMKETQGRKLRNWDLWGPLLLSLLLAMTLGINSNQSSDTIFGTIFIIMWGGSAVITVNAKLLGGQVSFFQSVCVLGYCVFPINVAAVVITFLQSYFGFFLRLIIVGVAFLWSTFSSLSFMSSMMNEEKKVISVYPIFLFYMFLSWFCIFI
ncbi:unnamed protein product (macronuclear) [Paramecium tetraurelia]|uniref:Protein YIPF n=1 Tax=Paramecium tetraurelia TaxID=5888 RepID=A0DKR1_PARTE|nr:uncharacterized protein GSPATT00017958001 [Paramecium tetraurelia]CAK83628.1 unnamed protein product [Paramecium tetraurelia]|eukprot:XP_001451025.1 hypothetical protein (macronuclear) [Paramecium tetraurelia strain d4-2]